MRNWSERQQNNVHGVQEPVLDSGWTDSDCGYVLLLDIRPSNNNQQAVTSFDIH